MNRWVVYSTCSIFALCWPAGFAPAPGAEEAAVPPAVTDVEATPLAGLREPAPLPTRA